MNQLVWVLLMTKHLLIGAFFICGKFFAVPFYFTIVKPLTRYIFSLMGFILLLFTLNSSKQMMIVLSVLFVLSFHSITTKTDKVPTKKSKYFSWLAIKLVVVYITE